MASNRRAARQHRGNQRGESYADSYPYEDTTVLYYWRSTHWRRIVGRTVRSVQDQRRFAQFFALVPQVGHMLHQ